jgi:hypothetical protein
MATAAPLATTWPPGVTIVVGATKGGTATTDASAFDIFREVVGE